METSDFRDWPYLSYNATLLERPTRVALALVLAWFEDVERFAKAHQRPFDAGEILGATEDEWE